MSIGQVIELIKMSFGVEKVYCDLDLRLEFHAGFHMMQIIDLNNQKVYAIVHRPKPTVPGYVNEVLPPYGNLHTEG